jgi:predicted outer membrane repeat protein
LTVLSGDLAGDDVSGSFTNTADNRCHVVFVPAGFNVSLDGLAVRGGNANCSGGSAFQEGGGLIALSNSHLSVNNVAFQNNQANNSGGGLFADGTQVSLSAVQFVSNTATIGGGLAQSGGHVTVTSSSFVSNTAASLGGAVDIIVPQGHATLSVSNSSFTGNQATRTAGLSRTKSATACSTCRLPTSTSPTTRP